MEELRSVVLEILAASHSGDWNMIRQEAVAAARERTLAPEGGPLNKLIDEILWDLVIERLVTFGSRRDTAEPRWPFIYLTERGREVASGRPSPYDPDSYIRNLRQRVPNLDDILAQYLLEAAESFRRGLLFGAAVLCGAAAERAVLMLLEAIEAWEPDPTRKAQARSLLDRPRLPGIFTLIDTAVEDAKRNYLMPYAVHQGSDRHLLAFQEIIRVQRNDAVHPAIAAVSKEQVYLLIQTLPAALQVLEGIRQWFIANT